MHKIPTRDEIPASDTWDLTRLFPNEEAYRATFAELQGSYQKMTEFKGRLGKSAKDLLECLEQEKSLDLLAQKLRRRFQQRKPGSSRRVDEPFHKSPGSNIVYQSRDTADPR